MTQPVSLEDALAALAKLFRCVVTTETCPLGDAVGRVLAEDVSASLDLPPFDASAMDGYALAGDPGAARLAVSQRVAAGSGLPEALAPGTAARIFTGAPVPPGADRVIPQEDAEAAPDGVGFSDPGRAGGNIRPRGDDVRVGQKLFAAGHRLRPTDIAPLAAQGRVDVPVRAPVRVAIIATGDELVTPGAPLPPGSIYESNRFALSALLRCWGARIVWSRCVPDDPAVIAQALREAAGDADLIVTSGGMSVGEEDHVRAVVDANGMLDFWRVRVKPGKPVAVGSVFGTPILGLPGNPVSGAVMSMLFARPILLALGGALPEALPRLPLPALFHHEKKTPRREFLRATLMRDEAGVVTGVDLSGTQGSAQLAALSAADGVVDIPEGEGQVAPGDGVTFIPFFGALT